MSSSSWMMAASRMDLSTDAQRGRAVGSIIRISGRVLGVPLFAEEVVTEHEQPRSKTWKTIGEVRLLVIGPYHMGFEIAASGERSALRVVIDYAWPEHGISRRIGRMLGAW